MPSREPTPEAPLRVRERARCRDDDAPMHRRSRSRDDDKAPMRWISRSREDDSADDAPMRGRSRS
eukprot:11191063-Prorocentrum_lima.AAC.1